MDPDDHHLYASLGCALENLLLAGRAAERGAIEQAGAEPGATVRLLTTAQLKHDVADCVAEGNTAQFADAAWADELRS